MVKQQARGLFRGIRLIVLLFSLTGQLTLASGVPGLHVDAPEAVVEITRHDLGEVFAGEEVEHAFIVRNAGTKPLELKEKSSIGSGPVRPGSFPSNAMWRPTERLFARPVAALRAAPS